MDFVIRDALPRDFAEVGEVTVAAYRADGQLEAGHGYERVLADVRDRATDGEVIVAADSGTGRILGGVTFVLPSSRYSEMAADGEGEFRMLAVAPTAQRRGIGAALAQACVDRARRHGCTAVVICTRDFAAGAQRMYQRLGFVRTPDRDFDPLPGVRLLALRLDLPATGRPIPLPRPGQVSGSGEVARPGSPY